MKVSKISDLIDWTREMHSQLAQSLSSGSLQHDKEMANMILSYLADHERSLAKVIDGFEHHADPKALNTSVYDYLEHKPLDLSRSCTAPFSKMTFDEICRTVFDVHNQAIDLYRELLGRADIPEARELLQSLLEIEEHETMRLAQQTNRIRDM